VIRQRSVKAAFWRIRGTRRAAWAQDDDQPFKPRPLRSRQAGPTACSCVDMDPPRPTARRGLGFSQGHAGRRNLRRAWRRWAEARGRRGRLGASLTQLDRGAKTYWAATVDTGILGPAPARFELVNVQSGGEVFACAERAVADRQPVRLHRQSTARPSLGLLDAQTRSSAATRPSSSRCRCEVLRALEGLVASGGDDRTGQGRAPIRKARDRGHPG